MEALNCCKLNSLLQIQMPVRFPDANWQHVHDEKLADAVTVSGSKLNEINSVRFPITIWQTVLVIVRFQGLLHFRIMFKKVNVSECGKYMLFSI